MAKASWRTVNDEFDEEYVERLKNGTWVHRKSSMLRDGSGSWESTVEYISDNQAAALLISAGEDLTEAGLEEYEVDDR